MKSIIIFTDLDGTLLDFKTYSFKEAVTALEFLKKEKVPVIICSSKTRAEILSIREKLDNIHPFISENGGGIFIPREYFQEDELEQADYVSEDSHSYRLIRLGAPYQKLREALERLKEEGFKVKGFGDMSVEEISSLTHLSPEEAEKAKERDFDEPFIHIGPEKDVPLLLERIVQIGYKYTQGRFFHILGESNKGKAVKVLKNFYQISMDEIMTVALGDNPNDIPMLEVVDYPILVKEHDNTYNKMVTAHFERGRRLYKADGIGPKGWNKAVLSLPFT